MAQSIDRQEIDEGVRFAQASPAALTPAASTSIDISMHAYGSTTFFHSFVRMGRVPMMNLATSASGMSKSKFSTRTPRSSGGLVYLANALDRKCPRVWVRLEGMKTSTRTADESELTELVQAYADEGKARQLLEAWRWPKGPVCPHCQNAGQKRISQLAAKSPSRRGVRPGVYFCGACRRQFTVTVGTVMERSHLPISKWLMAWSLLCSSKKSLSANQIHRMLGVSYKTAWFMCHRIRFAMTPDPGAEAKLTGTVEVDETFVGPKAKRKTPVVALIERHGQARVRIIASVTQKNLGAALA